MKSSLATSAYCAAIALEFGVCITMILDRFHNMEWYDPIWEGEHGHMCNLFSTGEG
jgi:hypothetical protein